ncbi:hypothetical protein BaRGS_00021218 [Batillaria attramentaria]|uniref:Uncharacterized protein n=1 Tax=Batillaria attramentaria TaxID=370345 RepID=A0ABD0KK94_9CAEN
MAANGSTRHGDNVQGGESSSDTEDSDVKKSFCDYMIDTTAWNGMGKLRNPPHGFSRRKFQVVWTLLLLLTTGIMLWRLVLLINLYCSWPVQTEVDMKFRSRDMPALTFCNVNPIRRSRMDNLSCSLQNLLNHSSRACPEPDSYTAHRGLDTFFNRSHEILLEIVKQDRDEMEAAGHQIEDMLIHCAFAGNSCFSGNMSSYFTREWTMDYGNCYTMDTSGMHVSDSGAAAGLDLIFNLEAEESLSTYLTGYGMRVVVHERGTQPFPSADGLSAKFACNAWLNKEFNEIVSQGDRYCNCFNPCMETVYRIMVSTRKWPIAALLPVLEQEVCHRSGEDTDFSSCMAKKANRSNEDRFSSFLGVRIYFESLNYERIEQKPFYEVDRFLSDLGGMIGLFLGASALGLLEPFELLVPLGKWLYSKVRG